MKQACGINNQVKSSIVRRELGCSKISQKWEKEVLRAIKKVENPDNILL